MSSCRKQHLDPKRHTVIELDFDKSQRSGSEVLRTYESLPVLSVGVSSVVFVFALQIPVGPLYTSDLLGRPTLKHRT